MTDEKPIANALLRQDSATTGTARLSATVIARERLRVRLWAIATIVLWTLTAAMVIVTLIAYTTFIHPALVHSLQQLASDSKASDRLVPLTWALFYGSWTVVVVWSGLLLLAAASTVRLVFITRRATLSQIRESLAEISEQIRKLSSDQ
ncbi:MAG: hypothetical protein AB1486_26275 [Planctomycetota bacterium]